MVVIMPKLIKRLIAQSTTEVCEPITPWVDSLEALSAIAVAIVMTGKSGNFQCRIGIQTATATTDTVNAVVNPSVPATADDQITAVGATLVRFDPNDGSNGNIDAHKYFRLLICYSSSSGVPASGDLEISASWR
jgi:hypothetical protein